MEAKDTFLSLFDEASSDRSGEPGWLRQLRQNAMDRFGEMGLPKATDEAWRETSIKPIVEGTFGRSSSSESALASDYYYKGFDAHQLVFVNGRFNAERSNIGDLPAGVKLTNFADAVTKYGEMVQDYLGRLCDWKERSFAALNTALAGDGYFLHVPKNTVVDRPINVLWISEPGDQAAASFARNILIVEESADVKLVETHIGPQGTTYLTCPVTENFVSANANVDHYVVQDDSTKAFHIGEQCLEQGRDSRFRSHTFTFGASITRNGVFGYLRGENIDSILNGLYVLRGKQHCATFMQMEHIAPHCDSHELYKGVLDEESSGVFRGRIFVHQTAQKTDAKQTNQNLLLTDKAQVMSKPQLEIYADDVKCTHGATTGQLDREALFYLRSRGLRKNEARALLIHAFASDLTERVQIDAIRDKVEELLWERLPRS